MHLKRALAAITATLAVTMTTMTFPSSASAVSESHNILAVHASYDVLYEDADVRASIWPVTMNGVTSPWIAFLGGTDTSSRIELLVKKDQLDAAGVGNHTASRWQPTPNTIGVDYRGSSGCNQVTGTITIIEAPVYDEAGALAGFAADFALQCDNAAPLDIQLRYGSTLGWKLLLADQLPTGVNATVNDVVDTSATFVARGSTSVQTGQVSLGGTVYLGYAYWTITSDGCSNRTLLPLESCSIGLRFAPVVPWGYPQGNVDGNLTLPYGRSTPAVARFQGGVRPLPGQPFPPTTTPHFRRLRVTWGAPLATPPGENYRVEHYNIYEMRAGLPVYVAQSYFDWYDFTGLPTGYRASYQVRAVYDSGRIGPPSLTSAPGTTSSRELIYTQGSLGELMGRSLTPDGQAQVLISNSSPISSLSVGADQGWLAYAFDNGTSSNIAAAPVDGSAARVGLLDPQTTEWITEPAVSPDSASVIFTRRAEKNATATILRSWRRSTRQITDVPGSAGLTDAAFAPNGNSVIAVEHLGDTTRLVRLTLATGVRTPLAGTEGGRAPAVSRQGHIAFVQGPSGNGQTTLRMISSTGVVTDIPGVRAGSNNQPVWDPSGTQLVYVHSDAGTSDYTPETDVHVVYVKSGIDVALTPSDGIYVSTPAIVGTLPQIPRQTRIPRRVVARHVAIPRRR